MLSMLSGDRPSSPAAVDPGPSAIHSGQDAFSSDADPNSILFKHDRMYPHRLMRINYTTYDIRRSQDVINPFTSHCNVMVLADSDDDSSSGHRFRYAQVLGIYHANVVYVGPGTVDYHPRRIEFLWVRWYERLNAVQTGWTARKLDRLRFPPLASDDAFGFLDPSLVLRASHIIPAFDLEQIHTDGKGLSRCARDSGDWFGYYVAR
jgi:hypothetical protein